MAISRLFVEIGGDTSRLNKSLQDAIKTAEDAGVKITRAGQSFISKFDEALNPTKRLTEQIQLLEAAGKSQADIMKVMGDEIHQATKKARDMGQPIDDLIKKYGSLENRLKDAGDKMKNIGRNMSMYVTAPIAAAGAGAFKAAIDFESSFAGIRKTVDASEGEFRALAKGMRDMAKEIPISVNELNKIGEAAGQLGIENKNILAFTRTMADLGVTTNLTSEEAATAIARIANITNMSQSDFQRFGSAIVDMGNNFETTEAEVVELALRLAGAGNQINLTQAQIVGISAALSSVGVSAEAGGTAISTLFVNIAKEVELSGKLLPDIARVAGMSAKEFSKAFKTEPAEALEAFFKGLTSIKEQGGSVLVTLENLGITERRMRDSVLRLAGAGDVLEESLGRARDAWQENNALTEEARKRYETTESKLKLAQNALYDFGITLGENLLPNLKPVIENFTEIVKKFSELDPWIQKTIIGMLGISAAVGPAMYALGGLSTGVAGLIKLLGGGAAAGAAGAAGTTGLVGLLTKLGPLAAVTWAGFVGWSFGRHIAEIGNLDEKLAGLWKRMGLFQGRIKESAAGYEDNLVKAYNALLKESGEELDKLGIDISRGNKSLEDWAQVLGKANNALKQLHPAAKDTANLFNQVGTAGDDAGAGTIVLDDSLKKLREQFQNSAKPAEALAGEMQKLVAAGEPIATVMAAYGDKLITAAERQIALGQEISATTGKLYDQAAAFSLQAAAEKAYRESFKMGAAPAGGLFEDTDRAAAQAKKDLETAQEIIAKVSENSRDASMEDLELQKRILEAVIPRTQEEARRIEAERSALDYALKADEIRIKYATQREQIFEKIKDMDVGGEAYKQALQAVRDLDQAEQEALQRITQEKGVEALENYRSKYEEMIDQVRDSAGSIFDAITSRGKDAFQSLRDWIEATFLTGLKTLFQNFMASLMTGQGFSFQNMLAGVIPNLGGFGGTGAGAGGYGNILSGITGGGGIGDIISKIGGGGFDLQSAAEKAYQQSFQFGGLPGGSLGGGTGAGSFMGLTGGLGNLLQGGLMMGGSMAFFDSFKHGGVRGWGEAIGGGAAMGASIGSIIPGIGTAIGAAIGAAVGALSKAISKIGDWLTKTTEEAGAKEVARDYGGIKMTEEAFKQFYESVGLSESSSWGIRKELTSSPKFLTEQLWPLAEQQGKIDEFLESLERVQTSWGTFDFRKEFEIGMITGDFQKLNEAYQEAFANDERLMERMKDWEKKLAAAGTEIKSETDKLFDSFEGLRDSIKSSIQPVNSMFDTFVNTGRITDEFRAKILELGGDLAAFEELSGIVQLNDYFGEMVQHFRDTGEILPDLRRMISEYGGDLAALDAAAELPGLKQSLGVITSLQSGLANLAQEFDPIQKLLSGQMDASVIQALTQAGLQPERFSDLTGIISLEKNWANITESALGGGRISGELLDALSKYGGASGALAVERYGQGFNTITAELLAGTKASMDTAYQESIKEALSYLGTVGNQTSDKIADLTTAVEDQISIATDALTESLNAAKEDIVDALNEILVAIRLGPQAYEGAGTGIAKKGQPLTGAYAMPINVMEAPQEYWMTPPEERARLMTEEWQKKYEEIMLAAGPMAAEQWAAENPLPSLDTGGEVLKTGLAIVHRGESYSTAQNNRPSIVINYPTIYGWDDFVRQVRAAGLQLNDRGMPLSQSAY